MYNVSMALKESRRVMIWGELREGSVATPLQTNYNSFQDAIGSTFILKPLSVKCAFRQKPANQVLDAVIK